MKWENQDAQKNLNLKIWHQVGLDHFRRFHILVQGIKSHFLVSKALKGLVMSKLLSFEGCYNFCYYSVESNWYILKHTRMQM